MAVWPLARWQIRLLGPAPFAAAAACLAGLTLVFGTEKQGISDEVIASADEFLKIPMCGLVESLNVSASAAILIYMLSQRMRREVADWRLDDDRLSRMLYRWCRESVRDSEALLARGGFAER